jgi:hypothetical protein
MIFEAVGNQKPIIKAIAKIIVINIAMKAEVNPVFCIGLFFFKIIKLSKPYRILRRSNNIGIFFQLLKGI